MLCIVNIIYINIITGRAVFNYDFKSVTTESPVVKAVYRALKEAEHRSTSFIPYWNLPFAKYYMSNLIDFEANMKLLNDVLDELIIKAVETQNVADVEDLEKRDYSSMENPSLLRFLVDMRGEETSSKQLRDDLMTMLIAGHETTAAVLTWTFFELSQQPELYEKVRKEVDEALKGKQPTYEDMAHLPLIRLCLAETLRMYPQPPLLIRRALEDDVLPKGGAKDKTFLPKVLNSLIHALIFTANHTALTYTSIIRHVYRAVTSSSRPGTSTARPSTGKILTYTIRSASSNPSATPTGPTGAGTTLAVPSNYIPMRCSQTLPSCRLEVVVASA